MKFLDLLEKRRSIRKFTSELVNEDIENKILSRIMLAPSAGNLQAFKIFSIRNKGLIKKLWGASNRQDPIAMASLVLVFVADSELSAQRYSNRGRDLYSIQDATIATIYAHLITADVGLGSVWIGSFDTNQVQNILDLPKKDVPIAILPIGFSDIDPEPRTRRSVNEIVQKIN